MSAAADAENRSKTWAYQTISGDTTKALLSTPGGLIMTQAMTAMKRLRRKWIAENPRYTVVFGMTKHQTIEQSKMTHAFRRILPFQIFQCPEESSYLKNNTYSKYKTYNTKSLKIFLQSFLAKTVTPVDRSRTRGNRLLEGVPDLLAKSTLNNTTWMMYVCLYRLWNKYKILPKST